MNNSNIDNGSLFVNLVFVVRSTLCSNSEGARVVRLESASHPEDCRGESHFDVPSDVEIPATLRAREQGVLTLREGFGFEVVGLQIVSDTEALIVCSAMAKNHEIIESRIHNANEEVNVVVQMPGDHDKWKVELDGLAPLQAIEKAIAQHNHESEDESKVHAFYYNKAMYVVLRETFNA